MSETLSQIHWHWMYLLAYAETLVSDVILATHPGPGGWLAWSSGVALFVASQWRDALDLVQAYAVAYAPDLFKSWIEK